MSVRRSRPIDATTAPMPAAVMMAVVDSGPTERCRELPTKA